MTDVVERGATEELRRRAADLFPGGVNSPVRAFLAVDAEPILLTEGILLPRSPVEAWFISLAHGDVTIDETIRAAHLAFAS